MSKKQKDKPRVQADCEEIRNLIKKDPRKRKANTIFLAADLCGSRLLRGWEKGICPFLSTLEDLAKELHGCDDVGQIILNDPHVSCTKDYANPGIFYGELVVEAVLSPKYFQIVNATGGYDQVDVGDFVQSYYRRQVSSLDLTMVQMEGVLRDHCRVGLLRERAESIGPQFVLRELNERQCQSAYHIRVNAEALALKYVYSLAKSPHDDGAKKEFDKIIEKQERTLKLLDEASRLLRKEPSIANAIKVVYLDYDFHHGWGGFNTYMILNLRTGLGGHFQQLNKLIVAYCLLERKNIPLPAGYPSLAELVSDFYKETALIFQKLLIASTTEGRCTIEEVLELAGEHPETGYGYAKMAEKLIEISRPPGA